MSADRNYSCYIKDVLKSDPRDAKPADIVSAAGIKLNVDPKTGTALPGGDGEREIRSKLSQMIGRAEEAHFGTTIDEESKKRIRPVPGRHAEFHNRMVDDLYAKVAPTEAAAD